MLPPEFSRIARHFRPLAGPGSLDLTDDAAVFAPPAGRELVMTADAMVESVHFLPGTEPSLIARKLLRVNLSDLASMGAVPFGYLITISVPRALGEDWFTGFAAGLALDQKAFKINLLGGDTTETPGPLTLSLTAIGHVAPGAAILRSGAQPGDDLWVTGTIGDGVLGLYAARGELSDPDGYLKGRYDLPTPRLGLPIGGWARAAMDVSDGLFQDLGHICRASGVGRGGRGGADTALAAGHRGGAGFARDRLDRGRRLRAADGCPAGCAAAGRGGCDPDRPLPGGRRRRRYGSRRDGAAPGAARLEPLRLTRL